MKTIFAAILGGIVVFGWGAVSWMVLHWHDPTLKVFTDEEQVTQALTDNAPVSGIYVLPKPQTPQSNTLSDVTERLDADANARMSAGPFAFVAMTREGVNPDMTKQFGYGLGIDIIAALLIALLVRATNGLGYFQRLTFITTIGVIFALAGRLPDWIWWHFATDFMIVDCADVVISWFLAGLVMAALLGEDDNRLLGASYRRVRM